MQIAHIQTNNNNNVSISSASVVLRHFLPVTVRPKAYICMCGCMSLSHFCVCLCLQLSAKLRHICTSVCADVFKAKQLTCGVK